MSREDPQLKVRLPAELKSLIEQSAKSAGRSLNAEIVLRLERSFRDIELGSSLLVLLHAAVNDEMPAEMKADTQRFFESTKLKYLDYLKGKDE